MKLIPRNAKSPATTEWYVNGERVENISTRSVSRNGDDWNFKINVKYTKGDEVETNDKKQRRTNTKVEREQGTTDSGASKDTSEVSYE